MKVEGVGVERLDVLRQIVNVLLHADLLLFTNGVCVEHGHAKLV